MRNYKNLGDIYCIGDIIEYRPDGSVIYMSHRGILNLDTVGELKEEINNDKLFLESIGEDPDSIG